MGLMLIPPNGWKFANLNNAMCEVFKYRPDENIFPIPSWAWPKLTVEERLEKLSFKARNNYGNTWAYLVPDRVAQ